MKKMFKIIYSVLAGVTLVAFVPSIIWASLENSDVNKIVVKDAKITLGEHSRLEYIQNEELDTTDLTFTYNDKKADMEDLKIEYDFSKSGTRVATFTLEKGHNHYVAKLPLKVYHVRHVVTNDISISRSGEDWDFSKLNVVAELNEPSKSFPRPDNFPHDYQTAVILNEHQYKHNVEETAVEGVYKVNIYAGNASTSFNYYDQYTFNSERILPLVNFSGTQDKLTLFVEYSSNSFTPPTGSENITVTGKYLFESAKGIKNLYEFKYELNGWTSTFKSNEVDSRVVDAYNPHDSTLYPDGFTCVINGITFAAEANAWHMPILNMF